MTDVRVQARSTLPSEASRVSSNGGKVIKEKFPLGKFGCSALITDTDGNVIGLHSMQ